MAQQKKYRKTSETAVLLKTIFFLFSVVFIHPVVSYADWCLVHSHTDTQELVSHSVHIRDHLLQSPHDESICHLEETEANCVDASSDFIQAASQKSPDLKVAVAYLLSEINFPESNYVVDALENDFKNAPSRHLSILRSIVLIV